MNDKLAMAVEILPNIYLGDTRAAYSKNFFDKVDIRAVLNMTPNITNTFCENSDIEYMRIPVHDSFGKRDVNKVYQYFPSITEFMYKASVMENRNLLVHCALGRQRSCAAVGAYLIKFYKMTPMEAMNYIVKRKPDAFHWGKSANFSKSLNKWYHSLEEDEIAGCRKDNRAVKFSTLSDNEELNNPLENLKPINYFNF